MAPPLSTDLLMRANELAHQTTLIQDELTQAFEERYGVTYSEVDADSLIDALDYGSGGRITLRECDKIMLEHGKPVLKKKPTKGNKANG